MHPESPCRSVVTPKPKLSEPQYARRLVVVPCQYLPSPSPFLQPIFPSPSSHVSSVAVLHLFRRHIHLYYPTFLTPCSSAAVFTAGIVCHNHYPASPSCLHFHPPASLLRLSSHYLPSSCVLLRRCLYTFSDRIFSLLFIVLYYTACHALLCTIFLTIYYDLFTNLFFSLLAWLFSVSVMFLLWSYLPRFSCLAFTPPFSNMIIPLRYVCSYMIAPSLIFSTLIAPLMLWSDFSDLLGSACSDLLCISFLWTF